MAMDKSPGSNGYLPFEEQVSRFEKLLEQGLVERKPAAGWTESELQEAFETAKTLIPPAQKTIDRVVSILTEGPQHLDKFRRVFETRFGSSISIADLYKMDQVNITGFGSSRLVQMQSNRLKSLNERVTNLLTEAPGGRLQLFKFICYYEARYGLKITENDIKGLLDVKLLGGGSGFGRIVQLQRPRSESRGCAGPSRAFGAAQLGCEEKVVQEKEQSLTVSEFVQVQGPRCASQACSGAFGDTRTNCLKEIPAREEMRFKPEPAQSVTASSSKPRKRDTLEAGLQERNLLQNRMTGQEKREKTIELLKSVPDGVVSFAKFQKIFEKRYDSQINVSDMYQMEELMLTEGESGLVLNLRRDVLGAGPQEIDRCLIDSMWSDLELTNKQPCDFVRIEQPGGEMAIRRRFPCDDNKIEYLGVLSLGDGNRRNVYGRRPGNECEKTNAKRPRILEPGRGEARESNESGVKTDSSIKTVSRMLVESDGESDQTYNLDALRGAHRLLVEAKNRRRQAKFVGQIGRMKKEEYEIERLKCLIHQMNL